MFRGGDYIDQRNFADMNSNPGKNTMDISDIPGAKPKSLYPSRRFGNAGQNVMVDPTRMVPAGGLNRDSSKGAMDSVFNMGDQYRGYQNRQDRDPLSTKDINGSKKNQYGAKMTMPMEVNPRYEEHYQQPQNGYGNQQDAYNKENNTMLSPELAARKEALLREY